MLEDIEKAFDTAFFNADHSVKQIHSIIANIEDVVLSEDISSSVGGALAAVGNQISTMAFCFAQLMAKSILFSENYFILKERFQQLQIENFNLKSDKFFMDFVRKLNLLCANSGSTKSGSSSSKSKSEALSNRAAAAIRNKENNNTSVSNHHNQDTSRSSPYRRRRTNHHNSNNSSSPSHSKRKSNKLKKTNSAPVNGKLIKPEDITYTPPPLNGPLTTLEDHLLNNSNRRYLASNSTFRMHRLNNNAFRLIYRNFKETELINELNMKNVSLQKEIVMIKSELCNYRLVVRYLNNQMSGRIQQIQLLSRDKKDFNFEQVWSDLESEIQLNKFKTIIQALASNEQWKYNQQPNSLFNLFNSTSPSSMPNTPSIIRPKTEVVIERVGGEENNSVESSPQHQGLHSPGDSSEVSLLDGDHKDILSISDSDLNVNSFEEEDLLRSKLKNFKPAWFNMGLLRFVFVNLVDEAIGISIIGGKEYGLPIIISEIHAQTPASRVEAFKPGDIILTVNFIDMTDMMHDEAVALLKNLSGNTRFGVIYFKPDEHRYQQEQFTWIGSNASRSPSSASALVSPTRALSPGLVEMPQLLSHYYRSVFNTFLSMPFTFISDHSNSSADVTSEDDSNRSLYGSDSEHNNSDTNNNKYDQEEVEEEDNVFDSTDGSASALVSKQQARASTTRANRQLSSISPALVDTPLPMIDPSPNRSSKAFPGMAARLTSAVMKN